MPLTLVPPRKGLSRNYRIRGTVKAGDKSRYIDETTGVAIRERADEDELIHGLKPRRSFVEAAVNYAETLADHSTQRLRDHRQDPEERWQNKPLSGQRF